MASVQVLVRVVDGEGVVDEQIRRPVRLTPGGTAGVAFGGSVFPLVVGDVIDVAGPSWELEDCNRFLLTGSAIPYASGTARDREPLRDGYHGPWEIQSSGLATYVLFNGSERLAASAVDALERGGLPVQRWDVSHRPADGGRFYDWFARLLSVDELAADELSHRVATAFATPVESTSPGPVAVELPRVDDLQTRVDALLEQIAELQTELEAVRGQLADASRETERARASGIRLQQELDQSTERARVLREQQEVLLASTVGSHEIQALARQQADTEELLEFALAENAQLADLARRLDHQGAVDAGRIVELVETVAQLAEQLEEVGEQERERRQASRSNRGPQRGLEGFLASAFPRIDFVLDSVEVVANLESPAAILRELVRVDTGERTGKDLAGIRGWREVAKIATGIPGRLDMGRLYYRPDGNRVIVCVHVKRNDKEQDRLIRKLAELDPR